MRLRGFAACMLLAAVALPWIPHGVAVGIAVALLPLAKWGPRRIRGMVFGFSLCLLWVFFTGLPGENDLRSLTRPRAQSVRLRFEIRGDGDLYAFPGEERQLRTPVRVRERYDAGGWRSARGRVQLRLEGPEIAGLITGTVWEASGVLSPGNFSYVGLYRADWKFMPDPGSLQPLSASGKASWLTPFFKVRELLAKEITASCPNRPDVAATLKALLLGQRSELDRDTVQRFVRTGLIHVFAVASLYLH